MHHIHRQLNMLQEKQCYVLTHSPLNMSPLAFTSDTVVTVTL